MKLDLTPWARRDIDPVIRELLSGMEPRAATVHIGKAMRDWRAVITYHGWVLVDVRADGATDAAELAIETLGTPPDPIDEAKRREAIDASTIHDKNMHVTYDWRGFAIRVEVVD